MRKLKFNIAYLSKVFQSNSKGQSSDFYSSGHSPWTDQQISPFSVGVLILWDKNPKKPRERKNSELDLALTPKSL
jgi:hypothetical protein